MRTLVSAAQTAVLLACTPPASAESAFTGIDQAMVDDSPMVSERKVRLFDVDAHTAID